MSKPRVIKIERVKEAKLPPGMYVGEWSGYGITIKMNNGEWRLRTDTGVRGFVKVVLTVNDTGDIDVAA